MIAPNRTGQYSTPLDNENVAITPQLNNSDIVVIFSVKLANT